MQMEPRPFFALFLIVTGLLGYAPEMPGQDLADQVIYLQEDKEILGQVFAACSRDQDTPLNETIIKVAEYFESKPYTAHTLEIEPERLVVNLREFDCTTLAESCLAISRTLRSGNPGFDQFISELRNIRYREGVVRDYSSRIHYFSDWISLNSEKGIIRDISRELGGISLNRKVNFMSTHPDAYMQLEANPALKSKIAEQEAEISERLYYYIPEKKIGEIEDQLRDGDILGITTNIEGLDISHIGIAVRYMGRIHLIHASSTAGKVILSEKSLDAYLQSISTSTGIMVARPL